MKNKEIWIINHYSEAPPYGKYFRHLNFAKQLIKHGYILKIFTASTVHNTNFNYIEDSTPYLNQEIEGVEFVFIKTRNYFGNSKNRVLNMLDFYRGVKKHSKQFGKPDIIYSSSPHPLSWLAAGKIAKRYRVKHIAETRDLWPQTFVAMGKMKSTNPLVKLLYKVEKSIYESADDLIFTFPGGKQYISDKKLNAMNVHYINNGILLDTFNYEKSINIYNNNEFGDSDKFNVVFAGALGIANGVSIIFESAKILWDKGYKQIIFNIFGDGADLEYFMKFTAENKLGNVKFLGRVEKKYIPNILSRSNLNLFVLEDMYEVLKYGISPNKLFEYFASGVPTLSNVRTDYDLVTQYGAGKTITTYSAVDFAVEIESFYKMNRDDYELYCKNSLKAAKDFDFELLTNKLIRVIEGDD